MFLLLPLVGFLGLPLRTGPYTLFNNAAWLIGVRLLDGVGAGILGAVTPLLIADVKKGNGRFNVAQGRVATFKGIGASLSGLAAGEIVDHFGCAAFLDSGAVAALSSLALLLSPPETRNA